MVKIILKKCKWAITPHTNQEFLFKLFNAHAEAASRLDLPVSPALIPTLSKGS
jgi:hypothetical protein